MPKKQVAPCMFCGEIPCQCPTTSGNASSKASQPSSTEPKPSRFGQRVRTSPPPGVISSDPASSSPQPALKSIDFSEPLAPVSTPDRFGAKIASQAADDQDELEFKAALRILWPILSSGTKYKYRELMEVTMDAELFRRYGEIRKNFNVE